jgi:sulfoxide reductase heme-binding subunit YedZ
MRKPSPLRVVVHIVALAPLIWLAWGWWGAGLGPDPVGTAVRRTGRYALVFLLLSLLPSLLASIFHVRGARRYRRMLGLYAFFYAALHLLAYVGADYAFDLGLLWRAIPESPFVIAGLAAFVILLPLAITSTRGWQRRLGRNWRRLHRAAYVAAALAVVHYAWVFKELRAMPLVAGVALLIMLVARIPAMNRRLSGEASSSPEAPVE